MDDPKNNTLIFTPIASGVTIKLDCAADTYAGIYESWQGEGVTTHTGAYGVAASMLQSFKAERAAAKEPVHPAESDADKIAYTERQRLRARLNCIKPNRIWFDEQVGAMRMWERAMQMLDDMEGEAR